MTTHKVYVDTKNLSRKELEQLLIDKEQENKKLKDNIAWYEKEEDRLKEENKKLKEKLSEVTMVADDEKQSIEHILELEEENKNMKLVLEQMENTCKDYLNDRDALREENSTLKANIEFLHQCLDDRDKSIELLKKGLEEAYQEGLEQGCKHQ